MSYNQILIPVADAERSDPTPVPLLSKADTFHERGGDGLFAVLAGWILVHFTAFGYLAGLDLFLKLLQIARYLLWPTILVALAVHLGRAGSKVVVQTLAPIMPYFLIGAIAGVVGFDPVESSRLLVFWLLGVIGATTVGLEIPTHRFRRSLFLVFAGMILISILVVLFKPKLGLSADNRVGGGNAWNGFFPGKNLLGLICVYGLLITIFIEGWPRIAKISAYVMFGSVLFLSRSQGAVAAGAAVIAFYFLVATLRRARLSPVARSGVLVLAVVLGGIAIAVGYSVLSNLLGRDATLTGRTEVWPVWLARAMTNWPIGFGPGSFTEPSLVTIDLSASEQGLGAIHTPHNMFIAIFGEVGLFGLVAYLAPLLYFSFVLPFARTSRPAFFAAATAFTTLVSGLSETREVFGLGMNMFLTIATYANSRRYDAIRAAIVVPIGPAPAYAGAVALGD